MIEREHMIEDVKLDFWIKNNLNVLFIGRHGVGKTSMVIDAFERNGLRWKYFSASTMDPWVDFIGVPKEVTNGDDSYLELVRPKDFRDDAVEALFFDEFNRSHKKVRNAVMELIQFKSINGRKFHNLRIVWAAINPEDDEDDSYDVEKLDPAQKDRFHVCCTIPYRPSRGYFVRKYGRALALGAIEWWEQLPKNEQNAISPRRLDYALDIHAKNGDIRDVLPYSSNVKKLVSLLQQGPKKEMLAAFYAARNEQEARRFLDDQDNYTSSISLILEDKNWLKFFLPLISSENLANLMATNHDVFEHVILEHKNNPYYKKVIDNIVEANANPVLVRAIKRANVVDGKGQYQFYYNQNVSPQQFKSIIRLVESDPNSYDNTYYRGIAYHRIRYSIPKEANVEDAIKALQIIDNIATHSRAKTILRSMPNFIGVVNHLISIIHVSKNMSYPDILNKYKISGIVNKIEALGMIDALYRPLTSN